MKNVPVLRMMVRAAIAVVLGLGLGVSAPAAEITEITFDQIVGPAELIGQNFIPATSPNAHFSLDTGVARENVFAPLVPGALESQHWDLPVNVFTTGPVSSVMLAIDKDVTNRTRQTWTDFHIEIGTGVGGNFQVSNETDQLFFKSNPAARETTGAFPILVTDEPVDPDVLWFFGPPGLPPGGTAVFWLGINVPASLFDANGVASFTIRQIFTVPEPSSLAMCGVGVLGLIGVGVSRRRRRA